MPFEMIKSMVGVEPGQKIKWKGDIGDRTRIYTLTVAECLPNFILCIRKARGGNYYINVSYHELYVQKFGIIEPTAEDKT